MVLGALGCMNNADFEKKVVNDNIVPDVFIIYYLSTHTNNLNKYHTLTYLQTFRVIPQSIQNPLPMMGKPLNTSGFSMCEF